ncbi:putative nudix hydrolase 7, partial [Lachnellula cervina]
CKLEPYTTFKIFRGARGAGLYKKTMAPPRPELEKQYMSSNSKPKKEIAEPKPSASILLISPTNQILLLHRVQTSSSFASAHVFPGGNLSTSQDGEIPGPRDGGRHVDGMAYRIGAIRETFEESGILLAKKEDGSLLEVEEGVREKARKEIHAGKLKFQDWVKSLGGVIDSGGPHFSDPFLFNALYPFTRWITPPNLPKRFTTQMYIYFLPLTQTSAQNITSTYIVPTPTSDGGIEHTAALFASCREWLDQATKGEIILFPPQYYLMHLLSPFLNPSSTPLSTQELQNQRDVVLEFLQGDGDGKGVKWADKVMSPVGLLMRKSDGRSVLSLEKPGPELVGSGRAGDAERVVLVKFSKEGPRDVEVRWRREVLDEEKREKL